MATVKAKALHAMLTDAGRSFAKYHLRENVPLKKDIVYGIAPEREWMAKRLALFVENLANHRPELLTELLAKSREK